MSFNLALTQPDVFKANASHAGRFVNGDWTEGKDAAVPHPVMNIQGLEDPSVRVDGVMKPGGGWGPIPTLEEFIDFWKDTNGS